MRKIFITFLTSIFLCFNYANAQLTISMSSSDVNPGANATVDVTVSGFTNLASTEYSINYDSTVLEFVMFTDPTPLLDGLGGGLSGPINSSLKKGQLVVSWYDGDAASVPNGTKIFSIVFKAIGAAGTKSDVLTSNVPRKVEISDLNLNPVNLINNKGVVTIKGTPPPSGCTSPTCTNPNSLMLIGGEVNGAKGTRICVPVSVRNFTNMESGQGSVSWDPTLLKYDTIEIPTKTLPGLNKTNFTNPGADRIGFLWGSPDATPKSVTDNTVAFNICFDIIGNPITTACLKLNENTPVSQEWNNNLGEVPVCFTFGKVTIADPTDPEDVLIKTSSGTGKIGDTVCLDVTVDNFANIFSLESTWSWNPAELKFLRTEMYDLEGLNSSMFNSNGTTGTLKLAWSNGSSFTKTNGHRIFKICFELLCPGTSPYTATVAVPGPTIVSGNVNGSPASVPGSATGGAITITECGGPPIISCTTGAIVQPDCNGGTNGSVAMKVDNATNDCVFQWKNSAGGGVLKTGLVSQGNLGLTGVGAGNYTFEVLCSGVLKTTCTAPVGQPTAIVIPTNSFTNVGCGSKGSINITATSGGNGGYTYNWNPSQGNIANPTNLNAGTYLVTATDSKNCTGTASFVIGNTQGPLSAVTVSGTNVKCKDGNDGAALVSVSGGCTPYIYAWSSPSLSGANPQGLKAGTYTVTITDSASPAQSGTATVTITEPAAALSIAVTGLTGSSSPTATDGKINLTISGGTPIYKTVWTGGILDGNTSGALEVSNVKAGTYSVTVTDANGCTAVRSQIVVDIDGGTEITPELGSVTGGTGFSGFGVKCFGDSNGSISGVIAKGTYPIIVTLMAGNQTINTVTIVGPDYSFTNLAAGSYTVTASNPKGPSAPSAAIVITSPTKLAATVNVNCTNKNEETGSIVLNLNDTGTGNYSYAWQGLPDFDNEIESVPVGFYNVTVTDENDCELRLTNIQVKECDKSGDCYTASTVITPSLVDNMNDVFIINCVTDNSTDISIFDRYGRLVFNQDNYDNTWKGTDNDGKDLREGGYIWVLNVNFGQGRREIYKGTITILR